MKRRICSLLMAVVMVIGMLPMQAFAADSYQVKIAYNDALCDFFVYDINQESAEGYAIIENGGWATAVGGYASAIFEIKNIEQGYRIKSVSMNGEDWSESFIDGGYGGISRSFNSTLEISIELEKIPSVLPEITGVNVYDGTGEGNPLTSVNFLDGSTIPYLKSKVTFDTESIPTYHAGTYWYYSLDGSNYKRIDSWGCNNDFNVGWSGHESTDNNPVIDFETLQNYYIKVLAVGKAGYSQADSEVWSAPIEVNHTDCAHEWDGGVVKNEVSSTADGSVTYTCEKCGGTKVEIIAAGSGETADMVPAVTNINTSDTKLYWNGINDSSEIEHLLLEYSQDNGESWKTFGKFRPSDSGVEYWKTLPYAGLQGTISCWKATTVATAESGKENSIYMQDWGITTAVWEEDSTKPVTVSYVENGDAYDITLSGLTSGNEYIIYNQAEKNFTSNKLLEPLYVRATGETHTFSSNTIDSKTNYIVYQYAITGNQGYRTYTFTDVSGWNEIIPASAGGSTEMPKAVAPKSVEWHKHFYGNYTAESYFDYNGAISWQIGDMSKDQKFAIDVYKDDEVIWSTTYNWYASSAREYVSSHDFALSELENRGSGRYWFTVKVLGDGTTTADSDVVSSTNWNFTKAENKLAAPSDLSWTDTVVANWNEVENAGGYHIQAFYSANNGNATSTDGMTRVTNYVIFTGSEGNKTSFDVYNWMSKENRKDGYYYFKVRTISTDARNELSSDWSALSPAYAKGVTVTEGKFAAPTELTWGKVWISDDTETYDYPGAISFKENAADMQYTPWYTISVYKKGETEDKLVREFGWYSGSKNANEPYFVLTDFIDNYGNDLETGKYYFTVQACPNDTDTTSIASDVAISGIWDYTRPDAQIATPTGLEWKTDADGKPVATWTPIDDENLGGGSVEVWYSATNGADANWKRVGATGWSEAEGNDCNGEFAIFPYHQHLMNKYGNGYYYFIVQALSADVEKARHSEESDASPILPYGVTVEPESDVPAVANAYFSAGELRVKYSFNENTEEAFENAKYLKAEIWDGENWVTIMDNMGIRTDGGEGNFYVTYNSIEYDVPAGDYTKIRFTTVARSGHTDAVSEFDFDLTINRATDETKPAKITNIVYDETEGKYNVTLTGLAGSPDGVIMFNEEEDLRSCQVAYFHEDAFNGDETADAVITAAPSYVRNLTEDSKYIVFTVAQDVQTPNGDFDFTFDRTTASVTVTDVSGWKPCYEKCEHQWNEGVVTTPATCGADGVKTFTCTLCGETKTDVIPATGNHNYVGEVTTPATCGADGVKTFTCSVCSDSHTEVIPATGNHNYVGEVTTPATCGADGVKTFTCSVCSDSYTEVIPATGNHNYVGEVTTPATCGADGVKTFTCSGCNDSYTEVIPATNNHTWDTEYAKNDKTHWLPCANQACTAKKNEAEHSSDNKICDVDSVCECGYVVKKAGQHTFPTEWQMNETHHWKKCTVDGCSGEEKAEHTPVVDEAVPPTETTEGKTEGSHCEICGYKIKEQTNIPKLKAQDVSWTVNVVTWTYGQIPSMNNQIINNSIDENDWVFTYSSSDESVATVDANGKATIVGAGTCEIKATAPAVENQFVETSASYKLIVNKAPFTIKANDKTIVYGEAPANDGWTAEGYKYNDTADVVKGTAAYTYNYEQFGKAGAYEISVSGLTADNYEITFEKGALTVNKASDYTITLGNLEQLDKEVADVTAAIAPQDTTAVIKVEYKIGEEWGTTLPTVAGEYPVRAFLASSDNIATDNAYTTATLVVNRSIVVGDTNIEVNVDGEKAEIVVTPEELDEIIEKTEGEVTVELGGVKDVTELEIPGAFVDAVSKSEKTDGLVINTEDSSISMSEAVVDTVAENVKSGEDTIAVKLEAIEKNELNDKQQAALDAITQDAVIVEVSLVITHADGGETVLHQLGGNVEVTVPYAGPVAEGKYIVVSYVSDDGNVSYVRATYNAETKQVTFKTNHFSNYAIFESGNPSVVVNEGTGNGIYEAGATVTIKADEKSGYTFVGWQVNAGTVTLADANKAETTFVMPSENVEITATYRQNTPSGGGGGFAPSKPAVPEYVNPFTDVKEGDYFFDAVKWAVENDVTTGTTETTFSPDMICTRAQAVTFLYRAAGSPTVKGKDMPFADVADDAYFYNAVLWAMENGITKGISETEFAPDMICTREQIVTFLYRTAISMGKDVSVGEETNILSYDDAFDIGEWAIPAVQWAVGDGVMTGTSESTLAPQMECTRAQIVTFLFRAFEE